MRRIISMLLALCMICTMLPLTTLAAEQIAGGDSDDGLSWTLDSEGTLTISGTGPMEDNPWWEYWESIRNIVIADGVTSIQDYGFSGCVNLVTISIPDSVTEIGACAFASCSGLTSISIPGSVTEIGSEAFTYCSGLTSVSIPDGVTRIEDGTFDCCENLESVSIPDGVTYIGAYAFNGCSSLTNGSIPDGVTYIGAYAFNGCSSLTNVFIPGVVTEIGEHAFSDCSGLTSVSIPDGVTKIGEGVFASCENLESVSIPASVTEIGAQAFLLCSSLANISIPDSVTEIGAEAFNNCESLVSATLPKDLTVLPEGIFAFCYDLKEVTLPESLTEIGEGAFSNCGLTAIHFPDTLTTIGDHAFDSCGYLKRLDFPENLVSIGNNSFEYCSGLSYVRFPASVREIGEEAFMGGSSRTDFVFDGDAPVIGNDAFYFKRPVVFYPAGNETWTAENMLAYGASSIKWTDISVASITVDDISFTENTNGYSTSSGYYVYRYYPECTVVLDDGSVYQSEYGSVYIDGLSISVSYLDDQSYVNRWGVGSHEVTACFGQAQTDFTVTVTECPITGFEVEPLVLTEGENGYWEGHWDEDYNWISNSWFCYDVAPQRVTVYYKDGTSVTDTAFGIESLFNAAFTASSDQSYHNQWGPGIHTATATLMGLTSDYQVTIAENSAKDYTVTYTNASISLAGDIGVNYYAQLSDDVVADGGAYMKFTVDGQTQVIPVSEAEADADGTYRFSCKVAAKQMTEDITGQIYLADGTAVGESKVYSVKAYCDAAIAAYDGYEAYTDLVNLMKAMLNYGGYSQIQLGYNTENLANTGLDMALPDVTADDVEAYAHGAAGAEAGISVASVSLLLESTTTIRFYFNLDGTKTIDDYTFYVDGVETVPVEAGENQYYVDKVDVAAKDLDEMVTVTVGGLTAKYCGLSYVRQLTVLYPTYYPASLVNVARALYAYNQAANAYFG